MSERYESPLSSRYASDYMLRLFSSDTRYQTWRKLWTSLAEAEAVLGLPITNEQLEDLRNHITDIDYEYVSEREKSIRHDVMAHIDAYGKAAPSAAGIIHLGATSCYVTDNADLIIYRDGLLYLSEEIRKTMKLLADFADRYKSLPTLGYTHYQPAQLTTVGKRATMWLQDFWEDYKYLQYVLENMRFLGSRGAVGSEASFLTLFDGDEEKIDKLNKQLAERFGFKACFDVCGQTYPRKTDTFIINALSLLAQSAYRLGQDIRLLQHDGELEEPFENTQVGSSAMAYKRNPMRCERICSLARYLMVEAFNPVLTSSAQWLERTLDDSANRRMTMPEAFLCADSILRLVQNVASGLKVNKEVITSRVNDYLPFIETETLLVQAVKAGGDRQKIHELIRRHSMETVSELRKGKGNDLLEKLAREPDFTLSLAEMKNMLAAENYIGRCISQVDQFIAKIKPLFADVTTESVKISI